jgi:hypothetical protein
LCVALSVFGEDGAAKQVRLDKSALLKHKMECRQLGIEAEKEGFPHGGTNTIEGINKGLIYHDSIFAYNEQLNTCVILSGFELVTYKTKEITTFQATITDLLSHKTLMTYLVLGSKIAPASVTRMAFMKRARELFDDPLPKWLLLAPGQ